MLNASNLLRCVKKDVEILVNSLYPDTINKMANAVPRGEFQKVFRSGEYSPTYGEITFQGGQALLQHALRFSSRDERLTLYDLGSGVGKFCMQASITHANKLKKVIGVEISPSRHGMAINALSNLSKSSIPRSDIEFRCDDLMKTDVSDFPNIIFCASLTFSTDVIHAISDRLSSILSPGSLIYTFRAFPLNERLVDLGSVAVRTTWSDSSTLLAYKIQN